MGQEIKKILPVILLIAAVGLGWLSWQSYSGILIIQNQIKEFEDKIVVLNKAAGKTKEFISFAEKNSEVVNKLNIALPDNSNKPNLVSSLAGAAFSNGLLLKNISFENLHDMQAVSGEEEAQNFAEGKYKTQFVKLIFSGTYSSLKNFLIFTGKNLKLTDITSIDFKSFKTANEDFQVASYDFSVGLETYYLSKNDNISAESKISEVSKLADFSFFQGKQFMDLVSPEDYIIDTADTGDLGNKNIF